MTATEETPEPSADAERNAGAILWANDWGHDDVKNVVASLASIADDTNRARYDGPGIDLEKVMEDLLTPLRDIAFYLEQIEMDEGGNDRIVDTLSVADAIPVADNRGHVVAWALTARGDTLPIVISPGDPRPMVRRDWYR